MTRRSTGFPLQVRELVYARAAGYCEICGEHLSDMQYHHRRPRGMGGSQRRDTNTASNCLLLCGMCHQVIESHRERALQRGQLVRSGQSPLTTPVSYRGQWRLLDNEGHTYRIPEPAGGVAS